MFRKCFACLCCCFRKGDSMPDNPSNTLDIYAYLVVIASFVINLIVEGSYNAWSIAYTTLVDEFETTRANAAWAGSVFQSTPSMFGPFASAIINRYGCRKATIAGALIACLGWFIGSFSRSILFLALTFGLIGGFGLSLAYIPSLFIVAYYFKKRLSLASSIAVGGSGVGILLYAPLTDYLMREYTWRGAILIFSGFFLQMAACGMLFVVPENDKSIINGRTSSVKDAPINQLNDVDEGNEAKDDATKDDQAQVSTASPHRIIKSPGNGLKKGLIKFYHGSSPAYRPKTTMMMDPESHSLSASSNSTELSESLKTALYWSARNRSSTQKSSRLYKLYRKKRDSRRNEVHPTDSSNKASKVSSRNRESSGTLNKTALAMSGHKYLGQETADLIEKLSTAEEEKLIESEIHVKKVKKFIDFSLLGNRVYLLFCIQSFLVYLAYDTPLMNMPGFAISEGIPSEEAALLLSIYGIFTTLGQIGLGWLADLHYFDNISLYSSTTFVAGIATVIVSNAKSYIAFAIYCVIYGIFISANFALSTAIIIENLGKEALNDAFGICNFAQGMAILVGPPIGGYFYDITGNYKLTYIFAGLTITFSITVFYFDKFFSVCYYAWTKCRGRKVDNKTIRA